MDIIEQFSLLPVPTSPLVILGLPVDSVDGESGDRESRYYRPLIPSAIKLSLIVPTYNESRNIGRILEVLSHLLDQALPHEYELIVVDDDSPDQTWLVAQTLMSDYPCLRVMRRQGERGLSTAIIRGWQAAKGEVLGVIDGDLQHPPDIVLKLLAEINQGADLSVASRHIENGGVSDWSLGRRLLSRGAQILGLIALPRIISQVSDPMSGYFMVRRSAIANKFLNPVGYKILIEVLGRGDITRIAEVGYIFNERQTGESKVSWKQYIDYIHHLLRLRFSTRSRRGPRGRTIFPVSRFIRFALVGFGGLAVDMGVLFLLFDVLGLGLTRSAILATELAILNNFVWNDIWTFGDLTNHQRQWHQVLRRWAKFNLICLMGLVLKILVLNVLFNGFNLNAYVANFIAIVAVTLWNFWMNLQLSWRVTETQKD